MNNLDFSLSALVLSGGISLYQPQIINDCDKIDESDDTYFISSQFGIEQFSLKAIIEQKVNSLKFTFDMGIPQEDTFDRFLKAIVVDFTNYSKANLSDNLNVELYEEDCIRLFSLDNSKNINIVIYEEGDIFVSQIFKNKPSTQKYFKKNEIDYLDLVSQF